MNCGKFHISSRVMEKAVLWLCWGIVGLASLYLLHYVRRAFVCDRFVVKGVSMEPGFHTGEGVYVNKLLLGARIYTDFDFSKSSVSSFRMPGFRKARPGDVMILNYPFAETEDTINFRINYVYMKRCYGCPGDDVVIKDGYYVHPQTGGNVGNTCYQRVLSGTPDSLLEERGVVVKAFQLNKAMKWTIRDFGPLHVPARGDVVKLDSLNWKTYRKQIQYETGMMPAWKDGTVTLGCRPLKEYKFASDWYFFGGDNVLDSRDSRYFGLVPEEYIIGIVAGRR